MSRRWKQAILALAIFLAAFSVLLARRHLVASSFYRRGRRGGWIAPTMAAAQGGTTALQQGAIGISDDIDEVTRYPGCRTGLLLPSEYLAWRGCAPLEAAAEREFASLAATCSRFTSASVARGLQHDFARVAIVNNSVYYENTRLGNPLHGRLEALLAHLAQLAGEVELPNVDALFWLHGAQRQLRLKVNLFSPRLRYIARVLAAP